MKKLIAIAIGVALAGVGTVALAGRDSSGTMTFNSVAGGYPFQAGVISRSAMNAHFAELASELTDSASRSGKGGFTAPVRGADGTVSAPTFAFTNDTNTGIYRIGADNIGVSIGGTKTVDIASGAVSFVGSTTTTGIATFGDVHIAGTTTIDTGAVQTATITAGTGWSGTFQARKAAGSVVTLNVAAVADGSAAWTSVGTVPAGFRPTGTLGLITCHVADNSAGGKRIPALCNVGSNGVIDVNFTAAVDATYGAVYVTPQFTIGASDWVYLFVTYVQ